MLQFSPILSCKRWFEVILRHISLKLNGEMQPKYNTYTLQNNVWSKSQINIKSRLDLLSNSDIASINDIPTRQWSQTNVSHRTNILKSPVMSYAFDIKLIQCQFQWQCPVFSCPMSAVPKICFMNTAIKLFERGGGDIFMNTAIKHLQMGEGQSNIINGFVFLLPTNK